MNVELAKTAGFCFGVKRAVDTVYKQIEKHQSEKIFTYGPIIHNEEVIKDLRSHGVEVLNDEEELKTVDPDCAPVHALKRIQSETYPVSRLFEVGRAVY